MDRIFSARINDSIAMKINELSLKMHVSKKSVIEKAIDLLMQNFQKNSDSDVFDETCGAWKRDESPDETVSRIRNAFKESMRRNLQ